MGGGHFCLQQPRTQAVSYSKMLVPIYPTTCCHIPTDHNLNTLRTGDADLRLYITTVQDG